MRAPLWGGVAACLLAAGVTSRAAESDVLIETPAGRVAADAAGETVVVEGGVRASFSGALLRADRAALFRPTGELYVEGGVRLEWGGRILESDRAVVRLFAGEAVFWKARLLSALPEPGHPPVHLDAERMRVTFHETADAAGALREIRVVAVDGRISTCSHAEHDFAIRARRMSVRLLKETVTGEAGEPEEVYDDGRARVGFSTFRVLGQPFLILPPFTMDLKDPLLKSVEYGSRRRFGTYVKTLWGQTYAGRRVPALREIGVRKLQILGRIDWYELRGWGGGPEARYKGRTFRGEWSFYGIADEGAAHAEKTGESFAGEPNRWRLRLVHQHDFGDGWSAVAEIHRMSDSTFRSVYFEPEDRSGRPIENRLWIQKVSADSLFWFQERIRNNAFLTETEYLPQTGFQFFSVPIAGTDLLYSSRSEAANVRRNEADPVGGRGASYRTLRADTEQRISCPFETGFVSWEPYLGARETWYQEDAAGRDGLGRHATLYGLSAATEFYRVFDVESDALDVNRLRHNVIPRAALSGTRGVTEKPSRLLQFDAVDAVAPRETVDLSVRHLLLTKRGPRLENAVFADVDWRATWFPNPHRDHLETQPGGRVTARDFSDVTQDATLFPGSSVTLRSETVYDPYGGFVDTQATGASVSAGRIVRGSDRTGRYLFSADLDRAGRDWAAPAPPAGDDPFSEAGVGFAVEHRHRRDVDTRVNAALQVQFTERWGADYQVTRELEPLSRWGTRRLTVLRNLHDAVLRFHFEVDEEKDERIFSFDFTTYSF